jgi:ABC-type branched-subunit amino acid transport system substrate-binding protein
MRTTISRRTTFGAAIAVPVAWQLGRAHAETPGVTPNEIRIGNTIPYSGPASAYGTMGHLESAFFKMVTETGGVDGHKVNFISYDDCLSPPKTVEDVRRLVEEDGVAFLFSMLGTATNSAVVESLSRKKYLTCFLQPAAASGATTRNIHGLWAFNRIFGQRDKSTPNIPCGKIQQPRLRFFIRTTTSAKIISRGSKMCSAAISVKWW